jgi:predicted RNase H-like nuclease (RuvC/YqgF family)
MFGGMDWLTSTINGIGTPVIVAGDKPEPSAIIKKINTVFNAKLFSPERDFKIEEKRIAARQIGIKDVHERDAYVAAISAYNSYANKFKQIEHIANEKDYKNIEEIKAKVVSKYSINEALGNKKSGRK